MDSFLACGWFRFFHSWTRVCNKTGKSHPCNLTSIPSITYHTKTCVLVMQLCTAPRSLDSHTKVWTPLLPIAKTPIGPGLVMRLYDWRFINENIGWVSGLVVFCTHFWARSQKLSKGITKHTRLRETNSKFRPRKWQPKRHKKETHLNQPSICSGAMQKC